MKNRFFSVSSGFKSKRSVKNKNMKFNSYPRQQIEWIVGVLFIVVGLTCLCFPVLSADGLMVTVSIFCTLSALLLFYQAIHRRSLMEGLKGIGAAVLAAFFWSYRLTGLDMVATLYGLYMFATAGIMIIQGGMDLYEKSKDGWYFLLLALGDIILGSIAFSGAHKDQRFIQMLIGAYLLYQGIQTLVEQWAFSSHSGSRSWSFRHWSSLPVYIVAVGPSLLLRFAEKNHMDCESFPYDEAKNDKPVNLRVFVHTGLSGDHQFGHMTFSYKGIMYSYGNYDVSEEKLFRTFGPGIFFTVPMEIYVNNCCLYEDSTLFEFGLSLSPSQEENLQRQLAEIDKQIYRWYAPISRGPLSHEEFKRLEKDYACRLFWRTGSKFYKFRHGIWKTYWVLGNNCSLFASTILHNLDENYVLPRGINTPGEYFDFFSQAYRDPNSNVVYRSWHTAKLPHTLYDAAA